MLSGAAALSSLVHLSSSSEHGGKLEVKLFLLVTVTVCCGFGSTGTWQDPEYVNEHNGRRAVL